MTDTINFNNGKVFRVQTLTQSKIHDFEKANITKYSFQEKLDGIRGIYYDGCLYSRGNKMITLDNLTFDIPKMNNIVFDGEITSPDGGFEIVGGILSNKYKDYGDKVSSLVYNIFDLYNYDDKNMDRRNRILLLNKIITISHNVVLLPVFNFVSYELLKNKFDEIVKNGGEGLVAYLNDKPYEQKRSKNVLKIKRNDDFEFIIVGYKCDKNGCIIWICETTDKLNKFSVIPKMTSAERKKLYTECSKNKNFNKLYFGKKYKVSYYKLSDKNIPIHPVGLGFVDEI